MKQILITGGTGFIGSNIKNTLKELGHKVLSIGRSEKEDVCIELNNPNLEKILGDFIPNTICHFASGSNIARANENPKKELLNTVTGTENLIACLKKIKATPRIIYLSSQAVYSPTESCPISESHEAKPTTIYGKYKLQAENVIINNKFDYLIFRISSIFGSNQDFRKSGAIAKFINNLKNKKSPIVFNDINLAGDFIYINDVASVIIKTIHDNSLTTIKNEIFNLGSGVPVSLKEILDILYKYFPKAPSPIIENNELYLNKKQKGLYLDITKIKNKLQWSPKYNIELGLKDMLKNYEILC